MLCFSRSRGALAMALSLGVATTALAVPYASQVRNTGGNAWEFVLNDNADAVTVLRDGGNPVSLGTTAGRLSFDMTGFSTFEIQVSKAAATGWSEFNGGANLFADFEQPTGMAVNSIPTSPYFGTVYVNNSTTLTTGTGRTMGDGVYSVSADLQGVDLVTLNAIPVGDAGLTSLAKAPAPWDVTAGATISAWRMNLDDAGNVLVTDWADASGGIKYAAANLASGGLVLGTQGGPGGGVLSTVSDEFGLIPLHGSIISKPIVTGTLGDDLTVWALDEDLDSNLRTPPSTPLNSNNLWRWDVGDVTTGYTINPTLVIDSTQIPLASDGRLQFFSEGWNNVGVIAEVDRSEQHDKWYFMQPRDNGNEASLLVLTADGVDGRSPTLEWSSLQFSIDNNLDGFTDDAAVSSSTGIQDIFREAWGTQLSDDGTELYVMMSNQYSDTTSPTNNNPYVGPNSANLPGHVLIIPLDENGVPDIQIDDNGTAGDTSDDFLANVESIDIGANGDIARANIDLDAAGNVYVTNNITERLQVFSPGGNWLTTTSGSVAAMTSTGFSIVPLAPPMGLVGDYNNDGSVNAADYAVWRDNNGGTAVLPNDATPGTVDASDYNTWRANFGETAGSGSGAAVPEPTTVALAGLALLGLIGLVRRK